MKTLIIYHRADYDGVFSMFVTQTYIEQEDSENEFDTLGWNYGDNVPDIVELVQEYDRIIMVDISFPSEAMLELKRMKKYGVDTIWIDHHITAIKESQELGYDDLPGLRFDGLAAVENSWHHFFPGIEPPIIVQLLGTYDVWNKGRFDWENIVLPLQFALKAKYSINPEKISWDWPWLMNATLDELLPLIESGKLVLEYLKGTWKSAVKNYSWEITVGEKYKGICCLSTEFSSNLFGLKAKEYDVLMVVNYSPKNDYFKFSMYIDPSREGEFSAGEYIKTNYNGGGHKCAAGGILTKEQFLRLLNEKKV